MRRLHSMEKQPNQTMREWAATVRTQICVLEDLEVKVRWDEIFVTLSRGLSETTTLFLFTSVH
jgi:hypothetical protein